jgi:hypothetical protein
MRVHGGTNMSNFGKVMLIAAVILAIGAIFAVSAKTIVAQKNTIPVQETQTLAPTSCSAGSCNAGTCGGAQGGCGGNCAAAKTGSCGCGAK